MPAYKEKFIAFVDVLGFKELVSRSEQGVGLPLDELLDVVASMGTENDLAQVRQYGGTYCPTAPRIAKDLDFELTQISDCVIASSEISPAGVINLVGHCNSVVMRLLQKGLMCRGYLTRGQIFHKGQQVFGTGYQQALSSESTVRVFSREADDRGTPFVEIDEQVVKYVQERGDDCVKKMFARMTRHDEQIAAIFPFQNLSHGFAVAGWGVKFDPQRELRSNQSMRNLINHLKERVAGFVDLSNPSAVRKAAHYQAILNSQLVICDRTDEVIRDWGMPAVRVAFNAISPSKKTM